MAYSSLLALQTSFAVTVLAFLYSVYVTTSRRTYSLVRTGEQTRPRKLADTYRGEKGFEGLARFIVDATRYPLDAASPSKPPVFVSNCLTDMGCLERCRDQKHNVEKNMSHAVALVRVQNRNRSRSKTKYGSAVDASK